MMDRLLLIDQNYKLVLRPTVLPARQNTSLSEIKRLRKLQYALRGTFQTPVWRMAAKVQKVNVRIVALITVSRSHYVSYANGMCCTNMCT